MKTRVAEADDVAELCGEGIGLHGLVRPGAGTVRVASLSDDCLTIQMMHSETSLWSVYSLILESPLRKCKPDEEESQTHSKSNAPYKCG